MGLHHCSKLARCYSLGQNWYLKNDGQGGARGEVIGVPNLMDRHSMGKKLQNSKHFLSKIEDRVHSNNVVIQMYHLE